MPKETYHVGTQLTSATYELESVPSADVQSGVLTFDFLVSVVYNIVSLRHFLRHFVIKNLNGLSISIRNNSAITDPRTTVSLLYQSYC